MAKTALIAKLTAVEGKADDLRSALQALVAAADEEAGLEVYSVHGDRSAPEVFWFFELYTDAAAFDAHGQGDGMKAAMRSVGELLAVAPEVTVLDPVAAKGLKV